MQLLGAIITATLVGLAVAVPAVLKDPSIGLNSQQIAELNKAYTTAYGDEIVLITNYHDAAVAAFSKLKKDVSPLKKCNSQCGKTGAACSAA